VEFNGLWEARPAINNGLLGSQLESVDHTCMAPPLLRCSKKEFHFTLVFCEKYLDTNRLPKFAHSWIWHNISGTMLAHSNVSMELECVKVEGAAFIKWFDKLKWHVPLTKDYFLDVLKLIGIGINFWRNEYDNQKHVATTDCDVQCNAHKGKTRSKYLWGFWDDSMRLVLVAHSAPASIVVYSNFLAFW